MFGHLGIEWDIASASDEERAGLELPVLAAIDGLVIYGLAVYGGRPELTMQ